MEFNAQVRERAVIVAVVHLAGMWTFAVICAADVRQTGHDHHAVRGRICRRKANAPGTHVADVDLIAVRQIVLGVVDVGIEDGGAEITLVRQPGLRVRRDGKC